MPFRVAEQPRAAAVTRLCALARLDAPALAALDSAVERPRRFRVRREIHAEGQEITETLLILSGWAARVRVLEDGRRQIQNFLLPGDLIGWCGFEGPLANSTMVAITDVDVCVAPDPALSITLARAYAISRAHEEAHLLGQINRLGRLNAQERIADLLLELLERLELAGLAVDGGYPMPLTQELIADTLGLTSVHVNRTLQALRGQGDLTWKGRRLSLSRPAQLREMIGRSPVCVTRS